MGYIDKDALVAEIERRIDWDNDMAATFSDNSEHDYLCRVKEKVYKSLLSFINTIEIKEVDYKPIDKDFERDAVSFCIDTGLNTTPHIAKTIAKHFFELGLKAQKGE